ncbi:MAG TPA: DUF6491 family protein [Allosphingosinicella sp.]|nr:DUF6491 family protein [Allosphingosinicella sp.]
MMRVAIFALFVAVLLAGCTTEPQAPERLTRAARAPVECINLDQIVSRRPSGDRSILFEMTGGRVYRNALPGRCPGLERAGPSHIVEVEATGGQLCRGDRIRVYDPLEARNIGSGAFPQCRLGVFTPAGLAAGD